MNAVQEIQFNPADVWPDPDMSVLKATRPEPVAMTDDEFDLVFGPWSGWLRDAAEVKGAPVDYVAMSLLATASAAIGNARWVTPWEGWSEPPVLWVMLVGDPSAGKSPALDAVLDPVKEIERELAEAYRKERNEWDDKNELAGLALTQWKADARKSLAEGEEPEEKPTEADAGPPPLQERIRILDATTEKVAELVSVTWRGVISTRDELSGWMGGMDRYSNGGDRPFWLEAFGGRAYTVDRKSNPEPVVVDHLSVAVLGGTQPDKLDSLLVNADDDGLLARFLTIYPAPVPLTKPKARPDDATLIAAIKKLRELLPAQDDAGNLRPIFVPLSDKASDDVQEFRIQSRAWEAEATGIFKGHIGKLPGLAIRVACVLAHLDYAAGQNAPPVTEIDHRHLGRACHLVGEHLRQHAFRAYGATKAAPEIEAARTVANIIRHECPPSLTVRAIQQRGRTGLKSAKQVKEALGILVDANWLQAFRTETGGAPSITYGVNPKLQGMS